MSVPTQKSIFVGNVVSMLSHRVISRARLLIRGHPGVWSLALRPDDANQDPVVYGAEFGVVFLAKGPHTASIQDILDCLGLCHSSLEGERYFRLVVELM